MDYEQMWNELKKYLIGYIDAECEVSKITHQPYFLSKGNVARSDMLQEMFRLEKQNA